MWLLLGLILPEVSTFRWYYFRGGLPEDYSEKINGLKTESFLEILYRLYDMDHSEK